MQRFTVAILALALCGCAASVVLGNEAGGLVRIRGMLNGQAKGMATAEAECRKYGKLARYESTNELRGTLRYSCVKPD